MSAHLSMLKCTLGLSMIIGSMPAVAQLTIDEGVVVKFGPGAGLVVGGTVQLGEGVVLTALSDDSVAGQTSATAGTPAAGDWAGVRITATASSPFSRAEIRYAAIGLDLAHNYAPGFLSLIGNAIGVRLRGPISPQFSEYRFLSNGIGLQTLEDAQPQVLNSVFDGNTEYAVQNLAPTTSTVAARNNWWGHASGPLDPFDNPNGQGDPVSRGVDYAARLTTEPLIDCRMTPLDAVTPVPQAVFRLYCRNATEFRMSESLAFNGLPFLPMTAEHPFQLTPQPGTKTVYAQFRGASGQLRQVQSSVRYQVVGPVVRITTPPDGLVITADTTLPIRAEVSDSVAIGAVQFLAGGEVLEVDTEAPYQTTVDTAGRPNGSLPLRAVATNINGQSNENYPPVILRIQRPSGDQVPPVIGAPQFDGTPLLDGRELTGPGLLTVAVSDAGSGLSYAELELSGRNLDAVVVDGELRAQVEFTQIPNGPAVFRIDAVDVAGNVATLQRFVTLAQAAPPVPTLAAPVDGLTTTRPDLQVRGSTLPRAQIQIYLNGQPFEQAFSAGTNGQFVTGINLPAEGSFQISADATNAVGTSVRSEPVTVTYTIPPPSLVIEAPAANAEISQDVQLRASVVYLRPDTVLEFRVDGQLIGSDDRPPFAVDYPIASVPDGLRQLSVTARNGATTLTAQRDFRVRQLPPPPQPFVPPFVGSGLTAKPATPYGTTPVVISGRLRETDRPDAVPNAVATLVMRTQGFDRRIRINSDADGNFSFSYRPRSSDQGPYQVTVMHPDAMPFVGTTPTGVAEFTVNQLTPDKARLQLKAPRGFPQEFPINVTASPGDGASQVRLLLRAEDQPSGALPVGISLDGGQPQDVPAGQTAAFRPRLLSTEQSPPSGPLVVAVLAQESGTTVRARVRVDFELYPAQPVLVPAPASIYTAVRRGQEVTEVFTLRNDGLTAAESVGFALQPASGQPLHPWFSLVSPATVASLAPGDRLQVELRFAPGAGVPDGVYYGALQVTRGATPVGLVDVAVAVNEQGEGQARFKVVDIYTETLDAQNQPIPGLANARIVLTSETNANLRAEGQTNAQGEVTLSPLPPGRYLWRASAAGHEPAQGRLLIRPGIIVDERIFLDIATVAFTWSVTPTTIPDQYNVNITATYQTFVPAPVVVVEPPVLNLPDLAPGEFISGEWTVRNRGLVRADEVSLQLGPADAYFRVEVLGSLPNALEAGESVVLPYRITAVQALPGSNASRLALLDWLSPGAPPRTPARAPAGGSCGHYVYTVRIPYSYACAAGDRRNSSGGTSVHRAYGGGCGSGQTVYYGGGGGNGGGWAGGSGAPAAIVPQGPQCGPDCTEGCGCTGGCSPPVQTPNPPTDAPSPPSPPPQSCPAPGGSGPPPPIPLPNAGA